MKYTVIESQTRHLKSNKRLFLQPLRMGYLFIARYMQKIASSCGLQLNHKRANIWATRWIETYASITPYALIGGCSPAVSTFLDHWWSRLEYTFACSKDQIGILVHLRDRRGRELEKDEQRGFTTQIAGFRKTHLKHSIDFFQRGPLFR